MTPLVIKVPFGVPIVPGPAGPDGVAVGPFGVPGYPLGGPIPLGAAWGG